MHLMYKKYGSFSPMYLFSSWGLGTVDSNTICINLIQLSAFAFNLKPKFFALLGTSRAPYTLLTHCATSVTRKAEHNIHT